MTNALIVTTAMGISSNGLLFMKKRTNFSMTDPFGTNPPEPTPANTTKIIKKIIPQKTPRVFSQNVICNELLMTFSPMFG